MAIELATILAVPAAIKALLDVADKLTGSTAAGSNGRKDAERVVETINYIVKSLDEFALAARESEAWKEVHHITNRLQTDLGDTLSWVGAGRETFTKRCDSSRREKILAEIESARRPSASILMLELFATNEDAFSKIVIPPGYHVIKDRWDKHLISSCDAAAEAIREGDTFRFWNLMIDVQRFAFKLNELADKHLWQLVSEYNGVMKKLHTSLQEIGR